MSANADNAVKAAGPLPEGRTTGTDVAKPDKRPQIAKLLDNPEIKSRFALLAPKHLTGDRMVRVMLQALYRTPKLAECDAATLLGAMLSATGLGLEPNTPLGHAYLIPFEKRKKVGGEWVTDFVDCQLIIGYKGFIDLARRSGNLRSLHADVVYEGDEFSFEYGTDMHLRHIPKGAREGRKKLWAYAHATIEGGQAFEVLPYAEVLKIRDGSQGYASALRGKEKQTKAYTEAPWVKFEHEMAAKTMIRRLAKTLPLSLDMARAVALDEASERRGGVNYGQIVEMSSDAKTFEPMDAIADGRGEDEEVEPITTAERPKETVQTGQGEGQKTADSQPSQNKARTEGPAGPATQKPATEKKAASAPPAAKAPPPPEDEDDMGALGAFSQ